MKSTMLLIARTDAESAKLLSSTVDVVDHEFIKGVSSPDRALAEVIVAAEAEGKTGADIDRWAHLSLDADHQHWVWISLKASTQNTAGTVTLSSADPRDTPVVAFNTFGGAAAERDLQASFEGVEFARRAMDDLVPLDGSFTETQPGRANVSTEDEIKEYAATNSFGHHACCTAPIGPVLDSKFRVKGVAGLRVVDASAFLVVPGFFIQLPTYLLSAKAGAAILEDA